MFEKLKQRRIRKLKAREHDLVGLLRLNAAERAATDLGPENYNAYSANARELERRLEKVQRDLDRLKGNEPQPGKVVKIDERRHRRAS